MPPFPLLLRMQLDNVITFIANTVHGNDFAATRDRTIEVGHLSTFKRVGEEWEATPDIRGSLRRYAPSVFGRVEFMERTHQGYLLRLGCPLNVSCGVQDMFDKQISSLHAALAEDYRHPKGLIVGSWFSTSWKTFQYPSIERTFYLYVPNSICGSDLDLPSSGENVEIMVGLKKIEWCDKETGSVKYQYKLKAMTLYVLETTDLPVRSADYTCDSVLVSGCARCILDMGARNLIKQICPHSLQPTAWVECIVLASEIYAATSRGRRSPSLHAPGLSNPDSPPYTSAVMRLLFPHPEPVEPGVILECLLNKYDALLYRGALGREDSLRGAGEFRATILARIGEDLQAVEDDSRRNVSHRLVLVCPDWSAFGWSASAFREVYDEQLKVLGEHVQRQMLSWPYRRERIHWTENERLIVFLTLNTDISIPVHGDAPLAPNMGSLSKGSTVFIDATFHCNWAHRAQEPRVFSIEAIHVQKVLEKGRLFAEGDDEVACKVEDVMEVKKEEYD